MTFTTPAKDVVFIVIFFFLLLLFMISGLVILLGLRRPISASKKQKIIVFSIFAVISLMFISAQSLGVVDVLILGLTCAGLVFYMDRRSGKRG